MSEQDKRTPGRRGGHRSAVRDALAAPAALGGQLSPRAAALLLQALQIEHCDEAIPLGALRLAADGSGSSELRRLLNWLLHHPDGQALWHRMVQNNGALSRGLLHELADPSASGEAG